MDRCEGTSRPKQIAASGLHLISFTIGQPSPQKSARGGESFSFQIPPVPAGLPEPDVSVHAWKGNYVMEPLRLTATERGWRGFSWGAGVIRRQDIPSQELRATAKIRPPGEAIQWVPVRFSPSPSYRLVISSNASLEVASLRIVDESNQIVAQCSGPTRINQDLPCTWKAANLPAGTYRLIARSTDPNAPLLLNATLRHDPRWLSR
ncbi:MAG: hypothetical protein ACK41W_10240 [Cyanobacteriota bacterium]|jgi:hypothetical protein